MKNNTTKAVLLLLGGIITLMFACNTKKEEPAAAVVDKEQIKKEIQAKEDEYAALYNGAELKNIGYYADDATSFFQNRAPLVGKEAIVEFGYYKVVDSANIAINTGNYMVLFEKRNGKYVSVREMSASDMPIK